MGAVAREKQSGMSGVLRPFLAEHRVERDKADFRFICRVAGGKRVLRENIALFPEGVSFKRAEGISPLAFRRKSQ